MQAISRKPRGISNKRWHQYLRSRLRTKAKLSGPQVPVVALLPGVHETDGPLTPPRVSSPCQRTVSDLSPASDILSSSRVAQVLPTVTLGAREQSPLSASYPRHSAAEGLGKEGGAKDNKAASIAQGQHLQAVSPLALPSLSDRGRSPTTRSLDAHHRQRPLTVSNDFKGLPGQSVTRLEHKPHSGHSLVPGPLEYSPKPVLALTRAMSVAPVISTGRLQRPGNARKARSLELQSGERASNSRNGNCLGGVCVPTVMYLLENSENVCSPKHELRNVEKGFNATLGFPGEGPGDRGSVAKLSSASAPVTPPKTPPKAANFNPVPPWNEDLEVEVRGVVDSYLQSEAKGSGVVVTESRRILVPPPKTSKAAGPAPHNRTRQPPEPPVPRAKAKVSDPGISRVITVRPKADIVRPTPPPPPKARRAPQEQNRVVKPKFDTGFCYPSSPKTEEVPTNSTSFSGIRLSLQDNPDLPGIRPSMPLNLDRRLPVQENRDGGNTARGEGEVSVTGELVNAPKPKFARPTPKVKKSRQPDGSPVLIERSQTLGTSPEPVCTDQETGSTEPSVPECVRPRSSGLEQEVDSQDQIPTSVSGSQGCRTAPVSPVKGESQCGELETRHPKDPPPVVGSPEVVAPNSVEPEATSAKAAQGTGCDSAVNDSKLDDQCGTQFSVVRPEPAGAEVASPQIGGPKPGVPQGPGIPGTKSEYIGKVGALPLSPNVRTTGIGHNTAGSASSDHEADQMACVRVEESESQDSPKVGRSGASDLRMSEPASASTGADRVLPVSHGSSSILRCTSNALNLERVEQSTVWQEYSAVIEINANPNLSYRTVRVTHAPGKVEQLKVHASRRVLEILLLTWRSGVQLKELSRHVQGAEGSAVPMDASIRVPIGRLIVGSVLTARYERDPNGHPAEINASLVQTLLESPQGSEANCKRCDPLRNARIFVQGSGENVPMLMNLRMQLRPYPIGTTCEEALMELQLQSHTIVGLCRAFTHWMPIPGQFRMQPSWCTLVWPVPRGDGNS